MGRDRVSAVAVGALVVLAFGTTAYTAKHKFIDAPQATLSRGIPVPEWRTYVADGQRWGADDGSVQVVVFSDYQCPACARLDSALRDITAADRDVTVRVRHYPLEGHRVAEPAARAALCAGREMPFGQFHNALFSRQELLETSPLPAIAMEIGIRDTVALNVCMASPAVDSALMRDEVHAAALRVQVTPTFLINGQMYGGVPRDLARLIRLARDGN